MRVLDLFSGIGGFSLGLERAGFKTISFCEIDPYCRRILAKHWPGVPIIEDITTADFPDADIICGGFPCQDISLAGEGTGVAGERSGLWRELLRAIRVVGPRIAVVENVAALLGRGMGEILGDLAEIGYDAEWHCIPASALGAPHERDRVWIITYPIGSRREGLVQGQGIGASGSWGLCGPEDLQLVASAPFERGDSWPQPLIRRMDDGLPGRVDRLRCIGNSIVPQIAEMIGMALNVSVTTNKPERVQLSRKKGWRLAPNTAKVDRTTKWGNPFIVGKHGTRDHCVYLFRCMMSGYLCLSNGPSIKDQEAYIAMAKESKRELRGKNLACWCPKDASCHADVLLNLKQ